MTDTVVADTSSSRYTGRVKWFNNKAGYGFITVTDGSKSGTDVFVHHTSINVADEQYKYLVQGEYVDFAITTTNGGAHEFQASSVCGIKGGKLMCETRRDVRVSRAQYRETNAPAEEPAAVAQPKAPRSKPVNRRSDDSKQSRGEAKTSKQPRPKPVRKPASAKPQGEWVQVASKAPKKAAESK